MVTTRPPKTIVKPTALGPVANTDTKLLIYGLFQKGRVLAQDGHAQARVLEPRPLLPGRANDPGLAGRPETNQVRGARMNKIEGTGPLERHFFFWS